MTITIVESGMTFGPFDSSECFHVETSGAYKKIRPGVKMAEFVWLRRDASPNPKLWVVEAKSSSPKPAPPGRFKEFIDEIREKLVNALAMVFSARLGRPQSAHADLPTAISTMDLSKIDVRFILVVNGHKTEWLPNLKDALSTALLPTVRTWGITTPAMVVLNDASARKKALIQ